MVMRIPVGPFPHYYAIVDDEDYEWLSGFKWNPQHKGDMVYAITNVKTDNGYRTRRMHKMITEFTQTDHKNRIGLDNRRENLRETTTSNNCANQSSRKGTSKFKGVSRHENRIWKVQVCFDGKRIYLGLFDDEIEAAQAYDAKARELFGEFARLNFPNPGESGI